MKAPGAYLAALLASAVFISAPFHASAQEGKPKAEGKEKGKGEEKAKRDVYPFRGTVKTTDKTAMTITLAGKEKDRVVTVTSETRIAKEGKPATFGDIATGEMVRGQVKKTPEGKENAVSVYLGQPPEKKGGDKKDGDKKKKKE
jgi:hypothetical protein